MKIPINGKEKDAVIMAYLRQRFQVWHDDYYTGECYEIFDNDHASKSYLDPQDVEVKTCEACREIAKAAIAAADATRPSRNPLPSKAQIDAAIEWATKLDPVFGQGLSREFFYGVIEAALKVTE